MNAPEDTTGQEQPATSAGPPSGVADGQAAVPRAPDVIAPGRMRSVARMVLLAAVVGVVAALGAMIFQILLHLVMHWALGVVAGAEPHGPAGEWQMFGKAAAFFGDFSPLALLAAITLGGIVSGALVQRFAPEAEGHGTDAAIKAYHRGRGVIRPRVPLVKILASAVTIGTGGSGGREGPIAQIGAGFGSFLAMRLGLSVYERRILLAAGMGAGVAAIFRAPLAGAIFATEVLYRHDDFEAEALIPSFISCTSAYSVYGLLMQSLFGGDGFRHIFRIAPGLDFDNPLILLPLAALAMAMAGAAAAFIKAFYGARRLFERLPMPAWLKPAAGAAAAGGVALLAYALAVRIGPDAGRQALDVLSAGYGVLQDGMDGLLPAGTAEAVGVLALVGLGKIATTSLTIGAGGSGGVFGPSMVIGGALGGAIGLAFHAWMPSVVPRVDIFIIMGMAAFFSAAARTPVSTIIIVSELTGGYDLLLPAMWVSALAHLAIGDRLTIYHEQVPTRAHSPAHWGQFSHVLRGLSVAAAAPVRADFVAVPVDAPLRAVRRTVDRSDQTTFPVVDPEGGYRGLLDRGDILALPRRARPGRAVALDLVTEAVEPVRTDEDLSVVLGRFARLRYDELPVVAPDHPVVVGMIRRQDLLALHEERLSGLSSDDP